MRPGTRRASAAAGFCLILLAGCRNEMYDQPRYEPLEASEFFDNGTSARTLEPGTVAQIDPRDEPRDRLYPTSRTSGEPPATLPFPLDRTVLERGQDRYKIYCAPCHGLVGDGRGMIVQRGFSPPPKFWDKTVLEAPLGHYFDVITHGHGAMYGYASRIPPRDRWCIATYIRALQLSQNARVDQLPADDQKRLGNPEQGQPSKSDRQRSRESES